MLKLPFTRKKLPFFPSIVCHFLVNGKGRVIRRKNDKVAVITKNIFLCYPYVDYQLHINKFSTSTVIHKESV